jgi:hypothetical protein
MSQRKRKQGQHRRLLKYLRSQTGTTDPRALLMREQALLEKLDAMDHQIHDLTQTLDGVSDETDQSPEHILLSQQRTHLAYLRTMRADVQENVDVNRRIYEGLMANAKLLEK